MSEGLANLHVYTQSLALVKSIYSLCKKPEIRSDFSLSNQLKRASTSIPANIAEGFGRRTQKDFAQFISIALGSCNEIQAFLDCIANVYDSVDVIEIKHEYNMLSMKLYSLRKKLIQNYTKD